ncbi:type II toxin-antitoxin system RelE/ParE family toxin [Sphingomonas morindae]|uniref:Type II toxin-antitoxin system RelE/ParE family toxin n=1 Tax=Sphingomonas morindae TaxID=1541170 RepID=A0ABY4X730_9SPHN|nr:type II toxin-antitoxin system RelE/ParE family toxin [Sphingomonas morindae]USI72728.1 type II toxin-antitoxin system RelE/ParE family toxin [Sphingomonas morindae]
MKTLRTAAFQAWFDGLRDQATRSRIAGRILRIEAGQMGDVKSVGGGVSELRIHHGPGYRLYFTRRGAETIILLAGGDKDSQARDIAQAKALAARIP